MSESFLSCVLKEEHSITSAIKKWSKPVKGVECLRWCGKTVGKKKSPILLFSPYGRHGKSLYKVLWSLKHREEPLEGHFIMRTCKTTNCCNRDHLISVPHQFQRYFIILRSCGLLTKHICDEDYGVVSKYTEKVYWKLKEMGAVRLDVENPESKVEKVFSKGKK